MFGAARKHMVETQIINRQIHDPRILAAMRSVPREAFIQPFLRRFAYYDMPLPIGYGQTISQPYIVAKVCELLELTGIETVLDIGTGSGYQAAVLSQLTRRVISLEKIRPLAQSAQAVLHRLRYHRVKVLNKDGVFGASHDAPFDAIVSAAACRIVPEAWKSQVKEGGVIVLPLQKQHDQQLIRLRKSQSTFSIETFDKVTFVPLQLN